MEVMTMFDGSKRIDYDFLTISDKLPSLFNNYPELASLDSSNPYEYRLVFDISDNVLSFNIIVGYDLDEVIPNDIYTIQIDVAFPETIIKSSEASNPTLEDVLVVPEIDILEISTTSNSYDYELVITDPDNVLEIISIEVFRNDTLIGSDTLDNTLITGLEESTKYKLKISYTYDINDGKVYEAYLIQYFKTLDSSNPQ